MNSFIGWIGGKKHLRKYIIQLIPDDTEKYVEVFSGAGWVLFSKEQHPNQKEVDWIQSREIFNKYRYQI